MSHGDNNSKIPSTRTECLAWKTERIQAAGSVFALIAVAIGCFGLLSWFVGRVSWTQIVPTRPAMVPNTALGLILAGGATFLLRERSGWVRKGLAAGCAVVVLGIGLLTLAEYMGRLDLGIDLLLVKRSWVRSSPSRPSILTSCCFVCLGLALALFDWEPRARSRPAEWLALCSGFIAMISLLGHLYGTHAVYVFGSASSIGVALPTGMALLCLVAGILLRRPEQGWARILLDGGVRGFLVRRFGGVVVGVPILCGVFASLLARHGFSDIALLLGLLVASVIPVGLLLVSLTGKKVAQAHAALTESHDKARALFEYAADGIFVADLEGRYLEVNPVGAQMLGYSPAEMIGKSVTDLIPPGDIARLWRAREQLHTGSPQTEEWSLRRKDGTFVSVEVSARMLPDGRWQTFVRDISERKLAAELLRRSEARLSGLISISLDGILSIDQNQNIALFNQGAEAVFGWSQREVLGQPLEVLLPQRFRERHRRHVSDFGCGPEQTRLMHLRRLIWGLRKNGEEFPMEASISKLAADGGYLYTIIFRDISERVRLERTQQEHMAQQRLLSQLGPVLSASLDYEGVLNQLSNLLVRHVADICIALIIEDGEVRRLKAAHADPDKQEYADALSKIVLNPIHPHPVWQVIETGQPVLMREITDEGLKEFAQSEEHLALLRKANVCSVMVLPLRGRNTILGVLILDCCGDHRRYGAEDIHVGMEIAHRAALAVENAKLYQIAQQAIQARDALLEVVAHDLRNPLNTVQLSTELLKGPADKSQVIERIKHAVQRANTLVADLMDVSRMESGRMNLECGAVSSAQLVQDCVEAQKPASAAVPTELRMEIPAVLPTVWADSKRALQVFENLLGNALKFTPPGGTITVGGLERPTEVLFWVKDNGPGIPAHELPHLFDRFWQADKKDRRGSGLGLAIAKEIVEAHGGKIWAESVKQKGSCFWFTLPKAA